MHSNKKILQSPVKFNNNLYFFNLNSINKLGSGTLDGNCDCDHWWPWKGNWSRQCWETTSENQVEARDILFQMGEDNVTVTDRVFGEGHYLRPMFIQPYKSKNVLIEGITIVNSPMWIVHPVLCENVIIKNVNISRYESFKIR
jgi:polygalacturonase